MSILITGLLLLVLTHLLTIARPLRGKLVGTLGEARYKLIFSLSAAIAIGLMIYGKSQADYIELYAPPIWGRHGAWLMMLIAFILLTSTQGPSALRHYLKHPMLLSVVVWGGGHLLANGDLASVIMFGGMAGFSALMIILLFRRDGARGRVAYTWRNTLIQSLVGALVYMFVLFSHPFLFGVAAI